MSLPPVCLWSVRDGFLIVFANGIEVARFRRDLWPHLMVDLAQALKIPTDLPRTNAAQLSDPDTPLG